MRRRAKLRERVRAIGRRALLSGLIASLAAATAATGEVVDAAAGGFTVRTMVEIAAPPGEVYRALVEEVGSWWSPQHTYSGDAGRLSIDPRPGGCFCERLDDGGVQHMEIVNLEAPSLLRMKGGLGPLQAEAVTGHLTWQLEAVEAGTRLTLTYKVAGYVPAGLDTWASPVDGVLAESVERLKSFVETGSPA